MSSAYDIASFILDMVQCISEIFACCDASEGVVPQGPQTPSLDLAHLASLDQMNLHSKTRESRRYE